MKKFSKKEFKSACLLGNYRKVAEYLSKVEGKAKLLGKYKNIFGGDAYNIKAKDKAISHFLRLYEDYLKWALSSDNTTEECKTYLSNKLVPLFPNHQNVLEDDAWKAFCAAIEDFFKDRGYFLTFGVTPPYPTLYLWAKERRQMKNIALPEGSVEIEVVRMSKVITGGWLDYLSRGKIGAGGWVTDKGCTYFSHKYKSFSDEFKVSLLKHEAQHFFDLKKYPEMKSVDLEYRAKLVELIYHKKMKTFNFFLRNMADSDDSAFPHALAERKIIQGLSKKIFGKELETDKGAWTGKGKEVRKFSLELLREHSEKLKEDY